MENTVGDRIRELAQAKGFNMSAFSQHSRISASAISAITAGKSNPSYEMIGKIAGSFPDVSMEWLLFGHGPMLKRPALSLVETMATGFDQPQALTGESACWEMLKREEEQHKLLKKDYAEVKALLRQTSIELFFLRQKVATQNFVGNGDYSNAPPA